MHFERTGLHGTLTLSPGWLTVEMQLGFLISTMRSRIVEGIESALDEELGAAPAIVQRDGR